ncbi:hypothetical protein E3T26_04060 [Cryobacterium sp. TMT1-21]|uniref:Uncharacterized protein n=1 Tax=Cryobacterium shii TaxID=1259235 RepID=A0AAQ2C6F5_9MICO|nr:MULTISPECIES: hypothetical protein [Cryobacterium]TFC47493.1 hypothetical protein E3O49_07980 [Cryobacterium shii]TFC88923.1 hypothetical protein E3T24_02270 [Cryobacterium sp. TmT2-59]TFD16618.1 hypothetical protein E3T26_04060 [Cryobacterium sp. TMT1-21]TFD20850.1 hypothetical protein E3T42_00680 [Cryobacterium sp. TMT4-10]TFD28930.1 hypothetical protein E3T32_00465 [Cryobacterium sp. TMT2-23]
MKTDDVNQDSTADGLADELVGQLAAIDDQPLEERAAAYVQVHDRLRDHLEGGDVPRSTNS